MNLMLRIAIFLSLCGSQAYARGVNVGSGNSHSSGNGNQSGNGSGNTINININIGCILCGGGTSGSVDPRWHPPIVLKPDNGTK